jgi:hypothetical protein
MSDFLFLFWLGKTVQSLSNTQIQSEQEKEQYKQLLALLRILERLFDHRIEFLSATSTVNNEDVSQHQQHRQQSSIVKMAFYCFSLTLPLITQNVLSVRLHSPLLKLFFSLYEIEIKLL